MIYREIDANELLLSESELRRRVQVPEGADLGFTKEMEEKLLPLIKCKMTAVRTSVKLTDGKIDLGFGPISSENLKKVLWDFDEAFVFGVTLGMDIDRYILRLSKTSISETYLADSIASAYAEAAADKAQDMLLGVNSRNIRFSPGYGDLPLECQRAILKLLDAQNKLGITLTDSLLMKPQKSITAIVGI